MAWEQAKNDSNLQKTRQNQPFTQQNTYPRSPNPE
jgi:hypothetical protein